MPAQLICLRNNEKSTKEKGKKSNQRSKESIKDTCWTSKDFAECDKEKDKSMSYEELSESVKLSEGFRNKIYQDTEGFDTIGWGHKVVAGDPFKPGVEYTEDDLQLVFDKDLSRAIAQMKQLCAQNDITELPEKAEHVITEMCFQLGQTGVSKFKNMWKCLQEDNFIGASFEMLDSKWNKQTPNRCKKLSDLMKSCG